jgi:hypothetical protein
MLNLDVRRRGTTVARSVAAEAVSGSAEMDVRIGPG